MQAPTLNRGANLSQQPIQSVPAPQFPAVGRWIVTSLPRGWILVEGFGVKRMTEDAKAVAASIGLSEDKLEAGEPLEAYIEKQKNLIGAALREPAFAGPQLSAFAGAEEARLFLVRHVLEGAGPMTHIQTYVRLGAWVGILTFTALHGEVPQIRPEYEAFARGLRIGAEPVSQTQPAAAAQAGPQAGR